MEDLERRWSDCMVKGAQATTEMQQAARQVQNENTMLRTMLHDAGIADDVIAQRLAKMRQAEPPAAQVQAAMQAVPAASGIAMPPTQASSLMSGQLTLSGAAFPRVQVQSSASSSVWPLTPNSSNTDKERGLSDVPGLLNIQWPPLDPLLLDHPIDATQTTQPLLPNWDLNGWVTELSNIKDAFGAEVLVGHSFLSAAHSLLTATALKATPSDNQTFEYGQGHNFDFPDDAYQYTNDSSILDNVWTQIQIGRAHV